MHKFLLSISVSIVLFCGCSNVNTEHESPSLDTLAPSGSSAETPDKLRSDALKIVDQRMIAYNDHDIERFMALYSDDIEIYTYPDQLLGQGKKHLRKLFEPMFEEGVVNVKIHGQFVKDSYVVNHETVDYGESETEYVSVYEVRDGLIRSVRFVRD